MLPHPWFDEESYFDQHARLLNNEGTVRADKFVGMPGFFPGAWLTSATAAIVHRSAHPCPKGMRYFNRCRTMRLILNRAWSPKHLGAYAGGFAESDLLVEPATIDLIVDCGEPYTGSLVFILNAEKLLIAEQSEFDLGEYYWPDRALLRSALVS